jgi:hypothetical protein
MITNTSHALLDHLSQLASSPGLKLLNNRGLDADFDLGAAGTMPTCTIAFATAAHCASSRTMPSTERVQQ